MIAALKPSLTKVVLVLIAAIVVVVPLSLGVFTSSSNGPSKDKPAQAKPVSSNNPGTTKGSSANLTHQPVYLIGKDGSIFALGGTHFFGSLAGKTLGSKVVGAAVSASGEGYWLVTAKGHVFNFGNAKSLGSANSTTSPVVAMTAE